MVLFFVLVVSENLESASQEKFKGTELGGLTPQEQSSERDLPGTIVLGELRADITAGFPTGIELKVNFYFRFDPRTNTFLQLAPMIHERGDFYACHINGFIYVFGGKNHNGPIRACEK